MEHKIIFKLDRLRKSIFDFTRDLDSKSPSNWIAPWNGLHQSSSIEEVLFDFWYSDDQDGRETRTYPGLFSLTPQQITFAHEVNNAKDAFRQTVQQIKQDDNVNWRDIQEALAKRYKVLNESLSHSGLNRLHLKQVFRHLPLVVNRPEKVGFSWYSSGRSIKKITKQEAYTLLCKLNTEANHVKIQLERLSSIRDSEPLARVQKQAPVLRANLVFADNRRQSLNVSLPLLFPSEGRKELPIFNIPPALPPTSRNRLVRSDNKLDDEPFLPSIRVHRYINKIHPVFY